MSVRPFLRRPLAWRALLAGGVLATGLSTLAGGGAMGEWIHKASRAGVASPSGAASGVGQSASRAAPTSHATATATAWQAADPPPYAPGGDDLLPVGDPPAARRPALAAVDANAAPRPALQHATTPGLPPAPSVVLWLDRPRVAVGDRAVLYLAASASTDCIGSGLLEGQVLNNGRTVLPAQPAGRHGLGVRCSGPGGTVERRLQLVVPWPVLASSQLNRSLVDFDLGAQPTLRDLGLATPVFDVQTAADFFQEGRHARFVVSAEGGLVFVLARDESGRWLDRSAELLDAADRRGCRAPSAALTADFNGDGRPDVYLACRGADRDGERQLLFLSQPDGRYRRSETAFSLSARQAEALDVDGDGAVDVLSTDAATTATQWLRGRGNGQLDYGLK